jgi:hypothetical protein
MNQTNLEDDSRVLDQGTPNDVRMFPVKRGSSSQSIPIANFKRTPSELQLHEEEALAEFREHRMYHRIVTGMNTKTADSNQRKEQQWQHPSATESLENIIMAGNARFIPENQNHPAHLGIATKGIQMAYGGRLQHNLYAAAPPFHLMMPVSAEAFNSDDFDFQGEEEGIFELEL